MTKRKFFLLAMFFAWLAHEGQAQTRISLQQLPSCAATTQGNPTDVIIMAIVPTPSGTANFACYALIGAQIIAGTATTPPTILIQAAPVSVVGEVPSGTIDGANKVFTLANQGVALLQVFRNGLLQMAGLDYTASGNTVTFATAPQVGDILQANYQPH